MIRYFFRYSSFRGKISKTIIYVETFPPRARALQSFPKERSPTHERLHEGILILPRLDVGLNNESILIKLKFSSQAHHQTLSS